MDQQKDTTLEVRLRELRIDHTDTDDEGYNRLCGEEIKTLMALFHSELSKKDEEWREKIEQLWEDIYRRTLHDGYMRGAICAYVEPLFDALSKEGGTSRYYRVFFPKNSKAKAEVEEYNPETERMSFITIPKDNWEYEPSTGVWYPRKKANNKGESNG